MNVYVVLLEDPFASHFIGVYATKEAANRCVELQDREANTLSVKFLFKGDYHLS
jgi:hypothetical protein